MRRRKGSIQ